MSPEKNALREPAAAAPEPGRSNQPFPLPASGQGDSPAQPGAVDPLDPFSSVKHYLRAFFPDFRYRYQDDFYFAALREEFPHADLLAEMKTFHAWCLDRSATGPMNYRLTFRKWVSNAQARRRQP